MIKGGRHVLVAYITKPMAGDDRPRHKRVECTTVVFTDRSLHWSNWMSPENVSVVFIFPFKSAFTFHPAPISDRGLDGPRCSRISNVGSSARGLGWVADPLPAVLVVEVVALMVVVVLVVLVVVAIVVVWIWCWLWWLWLLWRL